MCPHADPCHLTRRAPAAPAGMHSFRRVPGSVSGTRCAVNSSGQVERGADGAPASTLHRFQGGRGISRACAPRFRCLVACRMLFSACSEPRRHGHQSARQAWLGTGVCVLIGVIGGGGSRAGRDGATRWQDYSCCLIRCGGRRRCRCSLGGIPRIPGWAGGTCNFPAL